MPTLHFVSPTTGGYMTIVGTLSVKKKKLHRVTQFFSVKHCALRFSEPFAAALSAQLVIRLGEPTRARNIEKHRHNRKNTIVRYLRYATLRFSDHWRIHDNHKYTVRRSEICNNFF